jgi:hypothetical protein
MLQDMGINVSDIEKLKAAGHYTVESIQMENKKNLLGKRAPTI